MNFKYFLVPLMALMTISCNTKKEDVGTSIEKETPVVPADYDPEKKLKELGITLTEASAPVANYVNAVRSGNLIFLSGKGPLQSNGENIEGKVGSDLTIEEGYEAAKITGINQLSVLKSELGNLNKVVRVVKVLGMVNAGPDFPDHPKVINGYSDLMVAVFGERGKHARAAVGMGSLPGNIAVEIEMIVEVMPD
ncbi:RidA family protein [Arenibacter palladensis]|uniref:RidA family protein n=1 Tax=Arenibacter palladensis TaxID=237373 RepID=UPI0026E2D689|nr:RidA family protein [Arenibacter palladensis]MDO6601575.1 RidA family protein [Arenibacter palladensis]